MGMQISINNVLLNDVSKANLESAIQEFDSEIASCRERLMMFAASSPHPVADDEGNQVDWVEHVHFEVNQILAEFEEAVVNRHLANVALENPEDVTESF